MEALAAHPTVKPVALVADALLDCTARGDVVLDQFAGSGTTILAAEKVGRIGFGIEYEPMRSDPRAMKLLLLLVDRFVWTYPGVNSFGAGRDDALAMHPTVKPVALVADALRDCTSKGDLVLDPFLGSGTTVMAAERIGRLCFGLEYEPAYVDVTVRRWQAYTKADAILEGDGRTFDEIATERLATREALSPAKSGGAGA
jgi:DNA modification methylase